VITYVLAILAGLAIYQEFNLFLIRKKVRGPVKMMKGANSFFKKRGKKAVLLIHGFTSTPHEFKELAAYLARKNITVYAPLLPGHGTTPERLAVTKYYQWIEAVDEALAMLTQDYNEIYVIGNSFGGNLALLAANKSKKIKGIITLGAPIFFRNDRINRFFVIPLLKRIKIFQKKKYSKDAERINRTRKRIHYSAIPLRSLTHLFKIVSLTKKYLPKIKTPLLIMETDDDEIISNESGLFILDHVRSKDKRLVRIPKSYHVFILDVYAKQAFKEIVHFMEKKR